ncbi:MAG: DNA-binding protein [Halospina sp.]
MKLMALHAWREYRFIPPRPPMRTVQDWAATGRIPAVKRGGSWFVDIERGGTETGIEELDDILYGSKKTA